MKKKKEKIYLVTTLYKAFREESNDRV